MKSIWFLTIPEFHLGFLSEMKSSWKYKNGNQLFLLNWTKLDEILKFIHSKKALRTLAIQSGIQAGPNSHLHKIFIGTKQTLFFLKKLIRWKYNAHNNLNWYYHEICSTQNNFDYFEIAIANLLCANCSRYIHIPIHRANKGKMFNWIENSTIHGKIGKLVHIEMSFKKLPKWKDRKRNSCLTA